MNAYEALIVKHGELTGLVAKIAEENRMATDEEKGRISALKSDVEKINADFASTGRKAFLSSVSPTERPQGQFLTKSDSFFDACKSNFAPGDEEMSLGRLVRGIALGDWRGAELEKKAMTASTATAGGYLIPEPMSARVIDLARNRAALIQAGAATVPMTSSTLKMAAVTGDPSVGWYGEGQTIGETDMTFGARMLTAKKMAAIARVSSELLEDAANIDSLIESALAGAMALELDRSGLLGDGVGKPLGIVETDGIHKVENVGSFEDYSKFLTAIFKVRGVNHEPNSLIYSVRTAERLAKIAAGEYATEFVPPLPADMAALNRFATGQIPNNLGAGGAESIAVVGDFSKYVIGLRSQLRLEVSREADDAFHKDQTLIRVIWRGDGLVLQPGAFCLMSGITA